MNIRSTLAAALLAAATTSSFALTTYNFSTSFAPLPSNPGFIGTDGFGRSDTSGFGRSDARSAARAFGTLADPGYTPGVLPFNFIDNWTFSGVSSGTYTFETKIEANGLFALGSVLLGWNSGGTQHFANIPVSADFSMASALTTINVDGCNVTTCVWLNIQGWEDATSSPRGYNASITQVPEPESVALMLSGLAAIGWVMRRRRV